MISSTRAESTQLSHLFGIAMTAILITVVLTGGADYVDDQRADVAEQQLETIGNRLASELERVDELGREGARATVRTRVQARVSGENYDVNVSAGDTCRTENFDADRCLVLETVDGDASATVPLNVSSDLSLEQEGGGVLLLSVAGGGDRDGTAAAVVDRQLRIGVGRDFESNRFGSVTDPTNRPPVAKVDFSPGNPRSSDPVRFSAVESSDPDGSIVAYRWDFNDDGTFDELGPNVSRTLTPGRHRVTLQVVDNEDAKTNNTVTLRVSGVTYNGDLADTDEGTGINEGAVTFNVTNRWVSDIDSSVTVTHVMVEPKWDIPPGEPGYPVENNCRLPPSCPYGDFDNDGEVLVDDALSSGGEADGVGDVKNDPDSDRTPEIPEGGVIVELDEGDSNGATVFSDGTGQVWVGAFDSITDMSGRLLRLGVRYEVNGTRKSTTFTDVVGDPEIEDFRLETGADNEDVEAVIVSDKRLDTVRLDLGGDLSGTEDEGGMAVTERPDGLFEHRLFLGSFPSGGVAKANLTVARNDSAAAYETYGSKSLNRSTALVDGEYVWSNADNWDDSFAWEGVVHDSVGSRDPNTIRLGYRTSSQVGTSLAGYWHFDESAEDASGNGRDGQAFSVGSGLGVFGTPSYSFDGENGYVEITGLDGIHGGTSTLSMWIRTSSKGDFTYWQAPGLSGVEEAGGGNDIFWGWIDGSGRIGLQVGGARSAKSPTAIDDGQWHHVALTYRASDGNAKIFVDGDKVNETTTAPGGASTPFSSIGRIEDTGDSPEYFNGEIDEVRSYDGVLSESDVSDLAEPNGTIRTGWKSGSTVDASRLSLLYRADIPVGTTINVTVQADTNGNGTIDRESDTVTLSPDSNSVPVDGFGSFDASRYKLIIDLKTTTPIKSPVLDQIALTEDS